MAPKFKVKADPFGFVEMLRSKQRSVATAAVGALREVAAEAVDEGRDNIAGSGGFGPSWQKGLKRRMVNATDGGEPSLQAKAIIYHKSGLAGVFEHGATIAGKGGKLLWIPTEQGGPPASRSGKKLTSATINGTPVLFDANDRDRHRKPLYVGVPSVRIPKKWRITEIVEKHAAEIGEKFLALFKG